MLQRIAAIVFIFICASIGWMILAAPYFWKLRPYGATRYTLTNRRLMIQHGLQPAPVQEVALANIDEVRVVEDANSNFFRAARKRGARFTYRVRSGSQLSSVTSPLTGGERAGSYE